MAANGQPRATRPVRTRKGGSLWITDIGKRARLGAVSQRRFPQPPGDCLERCRQTEFGYTEVHEGPGNRFALGRYQITKAGLGSVDLMDGDGNWTGKYGIYSRAQFLAGPAAQEMALTDLLSDTERQLRANGSFRYVGRTIDGLVDRFAVTRAGLLAAGHRYGARETREYLDKEASSGFSSARVNLTPADRAVETRLRTFADVRFE
jgi:hypothetical protein